jgi:hypothetical protein
MVGGVVGVVGPTALKIVVVVNKQELEFVIILSHQVMEMIVRENLYKRKTVILQNVLLTAAGVVGVNIQNVPKLAELVKCPVIDYVTILSRISVAITVLEMHRKKHRVTRTNVQLLLFGIIGVPGVIALMANKTELEYAMVMLVLEKKKNRVIVKIKKMMKMKMMKMKKIAIL